MPANTNMGCGMPYVAILFNVFILSVIGGNVRLDCKCLQCPEHGLCRCGIMAGTHREPY